MTATRPSSEDDAAPLGSYAAGICAIILASAIALTWVTLPIIAAVEGVPLGSGSGTLLNGIGQVMIGAVAVYIGAQLPTHRRAILGQRVQLPGPTTEPEEIIVTTVPPEPNAPDQPETEKPTTPAQPTQPTPVQPDQGEPPSLTQPPEVVDGDTDLKEKLHHGDAGAGEEEADTDNEDRGSTD